jgi:N-acetylglucosamine-6-phosphate deacetylase
MSGTFTLCAAHYRTGAREVFRFQHGRLISRTPTRQCTDLLFGPGFCDLQCNGFAGVDFNGASFSAEKGAHAVRALWRHGCTHVLPTVISHSPERMAHVLETLASLAQRRDLAPSILGFHLEGPFLSPQEGARGAHPVEALRPVDLRLWQRLQKAAQGRIVLVTLAPEVRGALPFLQRLRQEKIVPALGHTLAIAEIIRQAAEAGALLSTHLGNGCPQLLPRHANPIFAQAGCDALRASFIPDGIHLPPEVLRSLVRAKGAERTLLVTDAMAAAGAPPGRYTLGDLEMEVGEDRIVRQPGQPNLAGSALTMDVAVANFAMMAAVPLAEAWDAASLRPRRLLQEAGALRRRSAPGMVIAQPGAGSLQIEATLLGSRLLWRAG